MEIARSWYVGSSPPVLWHYLTNLQLNSWVDFSFSGGKDSSCQPAAYSSAPPAFCLAGSAWPQPGSACVTPWPAGSHNRALPSAAAAQPSSWRVFSAVDYSCPNGIVFKSHSPWSLSSDSSCTEICTCPRNSIKINRITHLMEDLQYQHFFYKSRYPNEYDSWLFSNWFKVDVTWNSRCERILFLSMRVRIDSLTGAFTCSWKTSWSVLPKSQFSLISNQVLLQFVKINGTINYSSQNVNNNISTIMIFYYIFEKISSKTYCVYFEV